MSQRTIKTATEWQDEMSNTREGQATTKSPCVSLIPDWGFPMYRHWFPSLRSLSGDRSANQSDYPRTRHPDVPARANPPRNGKASWPDQSCLLYPDRLDDPDFYGPDRSDDHSQSAVSRILITPTRLYHVESSAFRGRIFHRAHNPKLLKFKGEAQHMMKAKSILNRFLKDQSGEGFLDVAMKVLIVVDIGAAVLAIMDTAMPNLFQGLIDKISTELTDIDIVA